MFAQTAYTQELALGVPGLSRAGELVPLRGVHLKGRQLTTTTDMPSLAATGRMHPDLIAANLDHVLPVVLAHGYCPLEIGKLREAVLAEVSWFQDTIVQFLFTNAR